VDFVSRWVQGSILYPVRKPRCSQRGMMVLPF
jgi:hypothetical protein